MILINASSFSSCYAKFIAKESKMLIKKLLNLKNILLPFLLIFGLCGFSGSSFAARTHDQHPHTVKTVKKAKKAKAHADAEKVKAEKKAKKATKAKTHADTAKVKAEKKAKKAKAHAEKTEKSAKKHMKENAKSKKAKAQKAMHERVRGNDEYIGEHNGHKLYKGPRGGKYYINSNGNKIYPPHLN